MLEVLSGPIIGAVIGYCTNYIAVKMLFYPRKEIRIGGHKVPFTPGAIPKGKPRLAKAVGNIVASTLLTEEDICKKILTPETETMVVDKVMSLLSANIRENGERLLGSLEKYEICQQNVTDKLTEQVMDALQKLNLAEIITRESTPVIREKVQGTMLAMFLNDEVLASFIQPIGAEIEKYIAEKGSVHIQPQITAKLEAVENTSLLHLCEEINLDEQQVREKVVSIYRNVVGTAASDVIKQLQVAEIIEDKINQMNVEELEKMVLTVMKKELDTIVNLGAIVGGVLGILNIFI